MSATKNKAEGTPEVKTDDPSVFEIAKEAISETLTVVYGAFQTATESYTIACVDFGIGLNEALTKWVAAGARRAAFFPFAGKICGGKSRTTLEQYMGAGEVFPLLPDAWKAAGHTAQIVEMATLASVSDPAERVKILEAARNPEVVVNQTNTKGEEEPVTDSEKRVRILANQYKAAQMTPEQLDAENKRVQDVGKKALTTLAGNMREDVLRDFRKIRKDLADGTIDSDTAIARALSKGARIGQLKANKGGANASLAVNQVFENERKGKTEKTDEEHAEDAALAAAGV